VRRPLIAAAVVVVAVTLQVTLINRIPLPHGAVPSLVLILVAAMSTTDGPLAGSIIGFAAGLALDIAPPGGQLVGESALVYCLTGYACGRLGQQVEGRALPTVLVAAAGAAAGEAAGAMLGVVFSDPEVTWAAVKHVLPYAMAYDVLLTPFACGIVQAIRPAPAADGTFASHAPAYAPRMFGATPSALRLAGQSTPRLRLAGLTTPLVKPKMTRQSEPRLRLAGASSPAIRPAMPRRETRMRFSGGPTAATRKPATARRVTRMRFSGGPTAATRKRARQATAAPKFHNRGDRRSQAQRLFGGGLWKGRPPRIARPGRGWLAQGKPLKKPSRRSPGKGWLTSEPARRMGRNRYASKNWMRSSRRRRVLSRLGGKR
jgi:rod shape-determining protein MreD